MINLSLEEAKYNELLESANTLEAIRNDFAKQGNVSMESIQEFNVKVPGMINERYPLESFTKNPSLTNYTTSLEFLEGMHKGVIAGLIVAGLAICGKIIHWVFTKFDLFGDDISAEIASSASTTTETIKEVESSTPVTEIISTAMSLDLIKDGGYNALDEFYLSETGMGFVSEIFTDIFLTQAFKDGKMLIGKLDEIIKYGPPVKESESVPFDEKQLTKSLDTLFNVLSRSSHTKVAKTDIGEMFTQHSVKLRGLDNKPALGKPSRDLYPLIKMFATKAPRELGEFVKVFAKHKNSAKELEADIKSAQAKAEMFKSSNDVVVKRYIAAIKSLSHIIAKYTQMIGIVLMQLNKVSDDCTKYVKLIRKSLKH